jgi:hypothetical protein
MRRPVTVISFYLTLFLLISLRCNCNQDSGTGPVDKIYRSKLVGKVVDKKNKGIPNVIVTAYPDGHTTVSDNNGYFRLPDLTGGVDYSLHFSRYDYRDTSIGTFRLGYDDEDTLGNVKMTWRYGSISGVVYLDKEGGDTAKWSGIEVEKQSQSKLLLNGVFSFDRVEPGTTDGMVRLIAALPGTGFGVADVPLQADTSLENVAVVITRQGGSVTGTIIDEKNVPVSNAEVFALGGAISTVTDSHGIYVLNNIPSEGEVIITFKTEKGEAITVGNVKAVENEIRQIAPVILTKSVKDIRTGLTLTPSPVNLNSIDSTVVLRVDIKNAESATVVKYFWDYDGEPGVDDSTVNAWLEIDRKLLDLGTKDTLRNVYVNVLTAEGELSDSAVVPVRVAKGETDKKLPVITGVVVDSEGKPFSGVSVYLAGVKLSAVSGQDGSFSFFTEGLSDQKDTLRFFKCGYKTVSTPISSYNRIIETVVLHSSVPPEITSEPSDTTVFDSSSVTFRVEAAGDDLLYQWFRNDTAITGENSSSFTILARMADNGVVYKCKVYNCSDSVFTREIMLNVQGRAPVIITHPRDTTVEENSAVSFSVTAAGDGLTYQWKRDNINIRSATGSSYTISSVTVNDSGATFKCIVTNSYGSIESNSATLNVVPVSKSNLVTNGDFSSGEEGWTLYGDLANGSIVNGEYKISIKGTPDTEYVNELVQDGIALDSGKTYVVSFDAYAEKERYISVSLMETDDPWASYMYEEISLSTDNEKYSIEFTMKYPSDSNSRLVICAGSSTAAVYLDNIGIYRKD